MSLRDPSPLTESASTPAILAYVVEELREAIISCEVLPEERLVEKDIADRFDVSRWPVREALRVLEKERLVTIRPNRGASVKTITEEDIIEVYALKNSIGQLALRRLIADNVVTEELDFRLAEQVETYKLETARNPGSQMERDLELQSTIVEASNLPRALEQFKGLTREIRRFVNALDVHAGPGHRKLWEDHEVLIGAIRNRDVQAAIDQWQHITERSIGEFITAIPDEYGSLDPAKWEWV